MNARDINLSELTESRLRQVMEDYGVGASQFVEEAIFRSIKFYEGLTQMFKEEENGSNP